MYGEMDAFDTICGDCACVNILEITEQDIRDCADLHAENGEPCGEDMIAAAIRGLREYQSREEIDQRVP